MAQPHHRDQGRLVGSGIDAASLFGTFGATAKSTSNHGETYNNKKERGLDENDCNFPHASYLPNPKDSPKTIRLNFVFLQNPEGKGNFEEGNPEHDAYLNEIINLMNQNYGQPSRKSCFNYDCPEVPDTKIRVSVTRTYLRHEGWDNTGRNCLEGCANLGGSCDFYLDELDKQLQAQNKEQAINVFFTTRKPAFEQLLQGNCDTKRSKTSCAMFPSRELEKQTRIHMVDLYLDYLDKSSDCPRKKFPDNTTEEYVSWGVLEGAKFIRHELGHALGLSHVSCPDNLMKDGYFRKALNPAQIARMHYCLSEMNVERYVEEREDLQD